MLEALAREGGHLGGEQSGHLVWLDGHVTGDGLAAGLLLWRVRGRSSLSEAAAVLSRYPQVLGASASGPASCPRRSPPWSSP